MPPGGCVEVDTGGLPIQQAVMGVPYKDVSGQVMGLIEQSRGAAKELGGTANVPVAEGRRISQCPQHRMETLIALANIHRIGTGQ